jgi:hypothetical protein
MLLRMVVESEGIIVPGVLFVTHTNQAYFQQPYDRGQNLSETKPGNFRSRTIRRRIRGKVLAKATIVVYLVSSRASPSVDDRDFVVCDLDHPDRWLANGRLDPD